MGHKMIWMKWLPGGLTRQGFRANLLKIPSRDIAPGKMALGLKIVDADTGQRVSTGRLIGRYLGYYVSTIPLLLGLIWVGIDKRKQGWHDKLAGTVVVRDTQKEPVQFDAQV